MNDSFAVIKYDVLSFKKDLDYSDLSVQAPEFIEEFDSEEKAKAKIDALRKVPSEEVEIDLSNNGHYKGPRYIYRIGVTR